MEGGNITGNKGSYGGGIYAYGLGGSEYQNTLIINGGTISNNIATLGGGIYAYGTKTFELNGGAISENTATSSGGGVYTQGWFEMKGGAISNNTASSNGGGVYVANYNQLTLNDGEITGNTAGSGNRIYLAGGTFILDSGEVKGSLYMDDDYTYNMVVASNGTIEIGDVQTESLSTGTTIYFNGTTWSTEKLYEACIGSTMYETLKGAVSNASNNDIIILVSDVEISERLDIDKQITIDLNGYDIIQTGTGSNSNVICLDGTNPYLILEDSNTINRTRYGYWENDKYEIVTIKPSSSISYTTLTGGIITGASGSTYGGGVYVFTGAFEMKGGNIAGNVSEEGGGVYVYTGKSFKMKGGNIIGNKATTNYTSTSGGGVRNGGTFEMTGGIISENKAIVGGGVGNTNNSYFKMTGGTLGENTSTNNTGHRIYMNDGTFQLNDASIKGYLYMNNDSFDMINSSNNGTVTIDNVEYASRLNGDVAVFNETNKTWSFQVDKPTGVSISISESSPIVYGTDVILTANYTEVAGLDYTYQWYKNGVEINSQTDKTLTLKNTSDSDDYKVKVTATDGLTSASTVSSTETVEITPKELTITATATNRNYDETTIVEVTANALNGVVGGDDVEIETVNLSGAISSANVGTYTVTDFVFALKGDATANYTLTQPTVTVDISKATHSNATKEISAMYGTSGSVDLSSYYVLDGSTLSLGTVIDTDNALNGDVILDSSSKKIDFEFKNDSNLDGKTVTVPITISSTNYENFILTITLTVSSQEEYVITFDWKDGTNKTEEETTKFSVLEIFPIPTRTDYVFLGWFTEEVGGIEVTAPHTFESNATLYAYWKVDESTLPNSISVSTTKEYVKGDTFDIDDFVVTANLNNGTETQLNSSDCTFELELSATLDGALVSGVHTLLVQYKGVETIVSFKVLDTFNIGGVVKDSENNPVENVSVEIYQKGKLITSTTSNINGEFNFIEAPEGIYNLVVQQILDGNDVVKTVLVDLKENIFEMIIMPEVGKNSLVEIENTSVLAVGNVDILASNINIGDNDTLEVITKVNKSENVDENNKISLNKNADETISEFIDISISYTITDENSVVTETIDETSILLEFVLELPEEYVNKNGYALYRTNSDGIEKLYTIPNSNGEYIEVNENLLTFHVKKFSTYAIAVSDLPITPPVDDNGSGDNGLGDNDLDDNELDDNDLDDNDLDNNGSGNNNLGSSYSGSNSSNNSSKTYSAKIENLNNAEITVSPTKASKGQTVTITIKPDDGYEISNVIVTDSKGNTIELTDKGNGIYTFIQGSSEVNIFVYTDLISEKSTAELSENSIEKTFNFIDVYDSDYYYDAVLWAVENGITVGKTETIFAPNHINTRGEAITFLWRSLGSPVVNMENPFDDIYETDYYYDAVLWAVSQGITFGTSETTFSPFENCNRSQIITLIYRSIGRPKVNIENLFDDIYETDYYYDAVLWAVENGVTFGTGENNFSPIDSCTRGQIVTFLFRFEKILEQS